MGPCLEGSMLFFLGDIWQGGIFFIHEKHDSWESRFLGICNHFENTMFFIKPNVQDVTTLNMILRFFELASGLKVNLFKSNLVGIHLDNSEVLHFAVILNCKTVNVPFTYLGLSFFEDTMFFIKPNVQDVTTLKVILRFFELASGLKVNLFKSNLVGIHLDNSEVLHFAVILNCKTVNVPFTYWGLSVGVDAKKVTT
ncbi:hypothetical protein GmHk_01G000663 [Glycine max]|nr:hypothetical protein GmHk_01G000663 [Glycine max]